MRNSKRKIAEEKFYAAKKPIKIWDVNVDNIVVSKLVETKTNIKYLIGIRFGKAIWPLIWIMPKMSGYVKTFNVKEGGNKLVSFRIDHEKPEKYKVIWTKIQDLKNI